MAGVPREGSCCVLCVEMGLLLAVTCYFRCTCEDGSWGKTWLTALPAAWASCSFWPLTSLHRWLHADLGSLLLLPVFWQQRVCNDRLAVPVLWDQHRCLECSGRDHSGAVSHQPEVSSSLGSSLGLVWTLARDLPAPRSCTMGDLDLLGVPWIECLLGF